MIELGDGELWVSADQEGSQVIILEKQPPDIGSGVSQLILLELPEICSVLTENPIELPSSRQRERFRQHQYL